MSGVGGGMVWSAVLSSVRSVVLFDTHNLSSFARHTWNIASCRCMHEQHGHPEPQAASSASPVAAPPPARPSWLGPASSASPVAAPSPARPSWLGPAGSAIVHNASSIAWSDDGPAAVSVISSRSRSSRRRLMMSRSNSFTHFRTNWDSFLGPTRWTSAACRGRFFFDTLFLHVKHTTLSSSFIFDLGRPGPPIPTTEAETLVGTEVRVAWPDRQMDGGWRQAVRRRRH